MTENSNQFEASTRKRRLKFWLAWFAYATVFAILNFSYHYLDDLARGRSGFFVQRLIEETTAVYAGATLIPLIIKFARRYRIDRRNWFRMLPIHLAGLLLFSAAHTSLNGIIRQLIYWTDGLGTYNYGIMWFRYPMEFMVDIATYSIWVTLTFLYDHYRESRDREVKTAQLEAQLAQARLQALRLQLQPHFLFNTLNMISTVMYEDVAAADRMIARLSDLLRLTLRNSQSQEVTLRQELEYLDLYLEIMKARFEHRLITTVNIDPTLTEALVPQLILQPLVENSIRHGANPLSGNVTVGISAQRENGAILLKVTDGGPGIFRSQAETLTEGIGLANTADRLRQLYGPAQSFTLRNEPAGGLLVQVRLPFHLEPGAAFKPNES